MWDGGGNSNSDGLLFIERCYIVRIQDCTLSNIAKSTADCLTVKNTFNFKWDGGNISGTFPLGTNRNGIRIGSGGTDPWVTSNIEITNTLIQYNGKYGVHIDHVGNIMDNLALDNVSIGKNSEWNIYVNSPDVSNVKLKNVHFEGSGWNNTNTPATGFGNLFAKDIKGLSVDTCLSFNAHTHFYLDGVEGFNFTGLKAFAGAGIIIPSSTMLKLRSTSNTCHGALRESENFIREDLIDTLYDISETNPINLLRDFCTHAENESGWSSRYEPNPDIYKNTIINRKGSFVSDQMYSPDGVDWYKMMIAKKYRGEKGSIPTAAPAEGQGTFMFNNNGVVQGTTGSQYIVMGWYYSGGAWRDMRTLTGT
tara:strand:- start:335 stop:1429 length:1095 start_codon:yes stop_codon:yes gene_type:complete